MNPQFFGGVHAASYRTNIAGMLDAISFSETVARSGQGFIALRNEGKCQLWTPHVLSERTPNQNGVLLEISKAKPGKALCSGKN